MQTNFEKQLTDVNGQSQLNKFLKVINVIVIMIEYYHE